jgi:hypothetical protein
MSPRDTYWFLAGAAAGLVAGACGVYLLVSTPGSGRTAAAVSASGAEITNTSTLLMPGDSPTTPERADAGTLDEVTRTLAQRLATKGGTDDEWRLLAQSYEYMGRNDDARSARMHVAATDSHPAAKADTTSPPAPAGIPDGTRIWGTVQIAGDLAATATPGTTLFIYANDATSPGPPLAVLRLRVEKWPVTFILDDADAMIPGRNLSASKSVQLEARISPSGEALPRAGDLVGNIADIDPRTKQPVNISIDHKIG